MIFQVRTPIGLLLSVWMVCAISGIGVVVGNAIASPSATHEPTPEEKMNARFPQPATVRHLIDLPLLDGDDRTIGFIRHVVRTPDGKIKLIVPYSPWFGWVSYQGIFDSFRRPVAVPIEVVAILARQIDALDMDRSEFDKAPTWSPQDGTPIPLDETVRIALARR
jgi:hypothetical protein